MTLAPQIGCDGSAEPIRAAKLPLRPGKTRCGAVNGRSVHAEWTIRVCQPPEGSAGASNQRLEVTVLAEARVS